MKNEVVSKGLLYSTDEISLCSIENASRHKIQIRNVNESRYFRTTV